MKKIWSIAWKDLTVVFRDPAALLMLLLTPFLLTLAIAFAFGGLGGGAPLSDIPVTIVNQDRGELGDLLVQLMQSEELGGLLAPTAIEDAAAARAEVDADLSAAVVVIPADFSESAAQAGGSRQVVVELYANPTRPNSVGVIRSIVDGFMSRIAAGRAAGQITVLQLVQSGALPAAEAASAGPAIGERAGRAAASLEPLTVRAEMAGVSASGFDWLTYMAPSMAIMFLMFTATAGGRAMLAERDAGTLPRMLTTPTTAAQVIGGKVLGTYLTGVAQISVLVLASGLIFGVRWGEPLAVAAVVLALVAAATGWGMVIAAYARTPGQANAVGTMIALIFGGLAGNFVPRQLLPRILQTASYISPNAWGLEAFIKLTGGGRLADVVLPIIALLAMAGVLFAVAVIAFRRQYR